MTANSPVYLLETHNSMFEKVQNLDLNNVMKRVKKHKPDINHTEAEKQYRFFIYLCAAHNGYLPVPNELVDEVWHSHILFTSDYSAFCNQVAGKFLHHCPPMKDFSEAELKERRQIMSDVTQEHFGFYPFKNGSYSDCDGCSNCASCGNSCGSGIS